MKRKITLIISLITVIMLILSACGGKVKAPETSISNTTNTTDTIETRSTITSETSNTSSAETTASIENSSNVTTPKSEGKQSPIVENSSKENNANAGNKQQASPKQKQTTTTKKAPPKTTKKTNPPTTKAPQRTWKYESGMSSELFNLINNHRKANGVPVLSFSQSCANGAKKRAEYNAKNQILAQHGVDQIGAGGGLKNSNDIFNVWKNSAGHNKNMLDAEYTKGGCAVYSDSNGFYYAITEFYMDW